MKNPFTFSDVVTKEAFCNRESELKELTTYIQDSQNILLYSHRRFGKTSLIFNVFDHLKKQNLKIDTFYVDLFGTLSERDFVAQVLSGLSQIEGKIERLAKLVQSAIRNVHFGFGVDPLTGKPDFSISFKTGYVENYLDDVMTLLQRLSQKRKLVVVFDEFQEAALYGEQGFEKRLRKNIQHHSEIAYIFCGSQRHILSEMFDDHHRALYKQALGFPLGKISTKDYVSWAKGLFAKNRVRIAEEIIENVVIRCDNHPMYVQQFLYHLWDQKDLTVEALNRVERKILQRNNIQYLTLWESLTLNQKKTLKLLIATGGIKIFNASAISAADLQSSAQVQRALESLMAKDIVIKNNAYRLQDVMFQKWIQVFL